MRAHRERGPAGRVVTLAPLLAACGGSEAAQPLASEPAACAEPAGGDSEGANFPGTVGVDVEGTGGVFDFRVTVSSPYDTPAHYADGWLVLDEAGTVFGEHALLHSHETE